MANKVYEKLKHIIKEWLIPTIVLLILFIVLTIRLPWSIYSPGGLIDVSDRINSKDIGENYFLTYVSFIEGTIPSLALAAILPNWDIIPNDEIKLEDEDMEDASKRDKIYLKESVSNALYVAYDRNGIKPNITKRHGYVVYVFEHATADFKVGDEILSYDGKDFIDFDELNAYIQEKTIGDSIDFVINRDNKEMKLNAKVRDIDGEGKIGVSLALEYEYDNEPNLEYMTKSSESGSSGGLMMTLALYDALSDEDLAKNRRISGTGTISLDGTVGEISGVKYKLAGAVKKKADIFIAPSANYKEAVSLKEKNDYDIEIIEAKTIDQVIEVLRN